MVTKEPIANIQNFFETEQISAASQKIVQKYFDSMINKRLKKATLEYNVNIMQFVLTHVKTDLDKLTVDDIEDFQSAIATWERLNGEEVADSTKKAYVIGFKRFLRWYAKRYGNRDYLDLSDTIDIKFGKKQKLPSDLLTDDEIQKMIEVASGARNKAMIAVFAESGCRVGETMSCRMLDVVPVNEGYELTFPEGKTGSRTVLLVYAARYLRTWLELHPLKDDPEAPLWATTRKRSEKYKNLQYKSVEYDTVLGIITRTALKAGIKKRVHPHLFRHSRATTLAKSWTESQLKNFLGWTAGSNMPATYVHLSGQDMRDSVREIYGLVEKKSDRGLEVVKCNRCSFLVPVGSKYCPRCGLSLTIDAKESDDDTVQKMLAILSQHPDVLMDLAAKAQK